MQGKGLGWFVRGFLVLFFRQKKNNRLTVEFIFCNNKVTTQVLKISKKRVKLYFSSKQIEIVSTPKS